MVDPSLYPNSGGGGGGGGGGGLALGSLGGVRSTAPLLSYSGDVVPKLGLLPGTLEVGWLH